MANVTPSIDKIATFFPNTRKRVLMTAAGTGPLIGKDNQRRIRLALKMPLSDGKLVGMPDWVGDPYALVAKQGSATDEPKILVQLDGVNVEFFTTDATKEPSLDLEGCMLSSFMLARGHEKKSGELADVDLYFTLKTNGWNKKLWTWMADNLNSSFWVTFEGTQMAMSFVGLAAETDEPDPASDAAIIRSADFEKEQAAKKDGDPRKPSKTSSTLSAKAREASAALDGKMELVGR